MSVNRTLAPIHDWQTPDVKSDCREVIIGMTKPNSRVGAISREQTVLTWSGPVSQSEDACEKALSETRIAWAVLAHLTGKNNPVLPEKFSSTRLKEGFGTGSFLLPGRHLNRQSLVDEYSEYPDVTNLDLSEIASDALMAAAARARLPRAGILAFIEPDRFRYGTSLRRYQNGIYFDDEDDCGFVESSEALRGLGIAFAMMCHLGHHSGDCHVLTMPDSATLHAALRSDLIAKARERSERVSVFLRNVGLPLIADEFLATYG